MANPWAIFKSFTKPSTRFVGKVISLNSAGGTTTLLLPGGGTLTVRGQGVAEGEWAFAVDGKLDGQAPGYPDEFVEFQI